MTFGKGSKFAALAAIGALAALPTIAGAESPRDRATGGGQILVDPDNPPSGGALDTVAFTAQREQGAAAGSTAADGQVQVNRRSGEAVKFHGIVDCLVVVGSKAYISGTQRGAVDENGDPIPFELFVQDNGEGALDDDDLGMIWYGEETTTNGPDQLGQFTPPNEDEFCGIEEDPSSKGDLPALGRGNYQVYDAA